MEAIRAQDHPLIQELIHSSPALVSTVSPDGTCPLAEAERLHLPPSLIQPIQAGDCGISEEVYLRKELAHRFGLQGKSCIAGSSFDLEGMYSKQALRMATESAYAFYPQLLRDLYSQTGLWKQVLDQLPPRCLDGVCPKDIAARLRRLPTLVANSLDHQQQSRKQLKRRLQQDGLIPFFHGWDGHFVSGLVSASYLTRCNKGQRPGKLQPGRVTYQIRNPEAIPGALQKLNCWTEAAFYEEMDRRLNLLEHHVSPLVDQKVGNCSSTAGYALEAAIVEFLFEDCLDLSARQELAAAVKRVRAHFTKDWTLDHYLTAHSKEGAWSVDWELLGKVLAKPAKETGVALARAQKIIGYARTHGNEEARAQLAQTALWSGIYGPDAADIREEIETIAPLEMLPIALRLFSYLI
ncbi:MAG: hypothetical protein KDK78_03995 [Chlamydiia bacterium]|nr:hypothetical protein [Chlamydiia bacterium]